MLKFTDIQVTFREIPDEITLCINLSRCPFHCKNCHSPELQQDVGHTLRLETIKKIINQNNGITCICFMGGNGDTDQLFKLIKAFNIENLSYYKPLKIAWYSGASDPNLSTPILPYLDYYKHGPYIEELGGLDSQTTNQQLLKINRKYNIKNPDLTYIKSIDNITNRFWTNIK